MPAPQDLSFSLATFDHRRACARLTRRLIPGWMRHMPLMALGFTLGLYISAAVLGRGGHAVPPLLAFSILSLAFFAYLVSSLLRRRKIWSSIQTAPLRQGVQSLSYDDSGLRLSGPGWRLDLDWSALQDVVETPQALLLLLGDLDYQPIPASAFADPAAQAACAAALRARLTAR